ncbi:MAG: hypothetical protein ACI35S_08010 [Anaeroplasma sp.]
MEMENEKEIITTNAQCPNCASGLFFDPKTKGLKCKNCGSVLDFEKSKNNLKQEYIESSVENNNWSKESRVFQCDTCGAKIIVTGFDVTTVCPYCGSDYVSKTDQLPGLKPDRVIPFNYDEIEAVEIFRKGVKKKFFVPRVFKKVLPENKVRGLLIPTFTFDTNTVSLYDGVLEKVTTTRDSKGNIKRHVDRFAIKGTKQLSYKDIVIESSSKFNEAQINSLLPYNMNEGYHFDYNFLRGYSVEHYQDSLNQCFSNAKSKIDEDIKRSILSGYNYTSIVKLNINTDYQNRMYSYSLLPVYTFEYVYKKKKYITIMNGQTGKIGKGLPISPLKVTLTVLGITILVVLVYLFLFLF